MKKKRPIEVTILGWISIIGNSLAIPLVYFDVVNKTNNEVIKSFLSTIGANSTYINPVMWIIIGIGVLRLNEATRKIAIFVSLTWLIISFFGMFLIPSQGAMDGAMFLLFAFKHNSAEICVTFIWIYILTRPGIKEQFK